MQIGSDFIFFKYFIYRVFTSFFYISSGFSTSINRTLARNNTYLFRKSETHQYDFVLHARIQEFCNALDQNQEDYKIFLVNTSFTRLYIIFFAEGRNDVKVIYKKWRAQGIFLLRSSQNFRIGTAFLP